MRINCIVSVFHLIRSLLIILKINNSIVSEWYQALDDKSVSVCILRIKFNIDLSFSKMRRLYWIKFINAYTQTEREREKERQKERKNQEELDRVHQRNFWKFQINETDSGGRVFLVKYVYIWIRFLMHEILLW